MIVHEIIEYHANHLFPLLQRQIGVTIEDSFETGLVCVKAAYPGINAAAVRMLRDTMRDREADCAIRRSIRRALESELLVIYISQRIVEDETVVKFVASQAKRHVYKALHHWWVTTNFAKTIVQISDLVKAVAGVSEKELHVHQVMSRPRPSLLGSHPHDAHLHEPNHPQSDRKSHNTFPRLSNRSSRESRWEESHSRHSNTVCSRSTVTVLHAFDDQVL